MLTVLFCSPLSKCEDVDEEVVVAPGSKSTGKTRIGPWVMLSIGPLTGILEMA